MKRSKLILNDLHIGVNRVAGASPVTAAAMRARILKEVRGLMLGHLDKDIIINGDLFDAYDIAFGDALAFYEIVCEWTAATENVVRSERKGEPPPTLTIGQGNHDKSKDSSRLSMFDFVTSILVARFPARVVVVKETTLLTPNILMIPHCTNQEIFNIELAKALELQTPHYILLHANFDNNFTVEADHSLNMSREQATALTAKGHVLIFAHEHQAREPAPGVVVAGNQFPTSVADCLNNPGNYKRAVVLPASAEVSVDALTEIETWRVEGSYTEIDWREINGADVPGEFIRVVGQATSIEAAAVIQAVAKLRQKSQAYVVPNGVKIEGIQDMAEIAVAAEEMKALDVMAYLYEQLEPEQVVVVKDLWAKYGGQEA